MRCSKGWACATMGSTGASVGPRKKNGRPMTGRPFEGTAQLHNCASGVVSSGDPIETNRAWLQVAGPRTGANPCSRRAGHYNMVTRNIGLMRGGGAPPLGLIPANRGQVVCGVWATAEGVRCNIGFRDDRRPVHWPPQFHVTAAKQSVNDCDSWSNCFLDSAIKRSSERNILRRSATQRPHVRGSDNFASSKPMNCAWLARITRRLNQSLTKIAARALGWALAAPDLERRTSL